jgi:hypothetical protein
MQAEGAGPAVPLPKAHNQKNKPCPGPIHVPRPLPRGSHPPVLSSLRSPARALSPMLPFVPLLPVPFCSHRHRTARIINEDLTVRALGAHENTSPRSRPELC